MSEPLNLRKEDKYDGRLFYWGRIAMAVMAIIAAITFIGSKIWVTQTEFIKHKEENVQHFHKLDKTMVRMEERQTSMHEDIREIKKAVRR